MKNQNPNVNIKTGINFSHSDAEMLTGFLSDPVRNQNLKTLKQICSLRQIADELFDTLEPAVRQKLTGSQPKP